MDASIIFKPIITEAVKSVFNTFRGSEIDIKQNQSDLSSGLERHMIEIANWSKEVQFYGMRSGEDVRENTIPLTIDTIARKFRGNRTDTDKIGERELLSGLENCMILGDPGSGKTTTIKRLVNILLFEDFSSDTDRWEYPIVIRLRAADAVHTLYRVIADAIGLKYTIINRASDESTSKKMHENIDKGVTETFGEEPLEYVVPEILDRSSALLFLDGLDEVPLERRAEMSVQIQNFALKLSRSKIIMSCRSGDFDANMQGFRVVEICPLDQNQVEMIASRWLPRPKRFIENIKLEPYRELVDRPLFLCQLMVLYRNTDYLPERPSSVYQMLTRLLLEDWDRRRQVKRGSKYADFNPDSKLEFLAGLAYHLTYRIKTNRFSRLELVEAYHAIHDLFSLPREQAQVVVGEIESHTGIITESGGEFYEFSHLSLQEYLCAHYLVREPFSDHLVDYLQVYPSPVAVAVSLAPTSSNWFANVVLSRSLAIGASRIAIGGFLTRLLQERPRFTESIYLGYGVIKLFLEFDASVTQELEEFLTIPAVRNSVLIALRQYVIVYTRSNKSHLFIEKQDISIEKGMGVLPPISGLLKRTSCDVLKNALHLRITTKKRKGKTIGVFREL